MSDRDRIIEARMKLRARFLDRMERTPSRADARPLGQGPPNRHGMPKLPPDQTATTPGRWPVLDLGGQPDIGTDRWHLRLDGAVRRPAVLRWADLLALEQVDEVSDFPCVTGWSRLDIAWKGVRFSTVAALVEPEEAVSHVLCHGFDGYTTNLPLEEALKDDVLLVHTADGAPLPREHGGPVRMITPQSGRGRAPSGFGASSSCARIGRGSGRSGATRTRPTRGATIVIPDRTRVRRSSLEATGPWSSAGRTARSRGRAPPGA